jgi:peptidoglycan/xylan/chitin deacetylase (PgdA/CDA1 family)
MNYKKLKRYYFLLVAFIILVGSISYMKVDDMSSYYSVDKQIQVLFRYDDFSEISHTEIELEVIRVFTEADIQCAFGIIPFPADSLAYSGAKNIRILAEAVCSGTVHPALHGYTHQMIGFGKGEFVGVPFEDQLSKIEKGKYFLEKELGVPVSTFIPPWNMYDDTTLDVMDRLNFQLLSAGVSGGPSNPNIKLQYLPATTDLKNLRKDVNTALKNTDPSPVLVVLVHSFDLEGTKSEIPSVDELENLIIWLENQPSVRISRWDSILTDINTDLSAKRLAVNQESILSQEKIPPFMRSGAKCEFLPSVYWSISHVPQASKFEYVLKTIVYSLLLVFISASISYFFFSLIPIYFFRKIIIFALVVLMAFILLSALQESGTFGWIKYLAMMILFG